MSLLQELQERKVIRSTIGYLIAAFGVAQGVQLLVDAFGWPRTIFTGTVALGIALIPVVILVSWYYDRGNIPWRKILLPVIAFAGIAVVGTIAFTIKGNSKKLDENLVAILPFRVTSASNDIAFLSEGALELLATKLTGEGGPRAIDPSAVMATVKGRKEDVGDGHWVAKRLGAKHLIVGSVVGTAQNFTISASLIDVGGTRAVPVEQSGSVDHLPAVIDSLATKLLAFNSGGSSQELASLTSASLPALRAYLDARDAYRNARFTKARDLFRKAVEIDSTFALAAMGHILSNSWESDVDDFEETSRRLLTTNINRLGPVDRLVALAVQSDSYPDRRTHEQIIKSWESVLQRAPDRADAWFLYGDRLVHYGRMAGYSNSDSLSRRAFNRALEIDSASLPPLVHLIDAAIAQGDVATVKRLNVLLQARDPNGRSARYQYGPRVRFLGDSAAMQALRASRDTAAFSELYLFTMAPIMDGRGVDDAIGAGDIWLKRAITPAERLTAANHLHDLYLTLGMPSRAADMLRERIRLGEQFMPHVQGVMDALYADGDTSFANESAVALERVRTSGDIVSRAGATCVLDQRKLMRGETVDVEKDVAFLRAGAVSAADSMSLHVCALTLRAIAEPTKQHVDDLDEFLKHGPRGNLWVVLLGNIAASRLYERLGDRTSALRAMRRWPLHPEGMKTGLTMIREEARLEGVAGDKVEAIRLYQMYLRSHIRAEPSLRPFDDAVRRDLARLTGEN